jgi:uncharacterized protein YcgI (DUF1989 family)
VSKNVGTFVENVVSYLYFSGYESLGGSHENKVLIPPKRRKTAPKSVTGNKNGNKLIWTKRDLTSNINFFMNVPVTPAGELMFADGVSEAGKYVEMRADMDVLVLISNCPQLNNPCNAYNPTPVQVLIWDVARR